MNSDDLPGRVHGIAQSSRRPKPHALWAGVALLGVAAAGTTMLVTLSDAQEIERPAASNATEQKNAPWNVLPLKNAFKGKFLIGTTLNYPALQGSAPIEVAIAIRHFNAITPENSLKPDALQRTEGRFTFSDGDHLVEIAEKCDATPIGHVLVWHQQTPAWFFQGPDSRPAGRTLALTRLRQHIAAVVGHYKGRINSGTLSMRL